MVGAETMEVRCVRYELEIEIKAKREQVWQALIDETQAWWLPDFHIVGADSVVEFDVTPGGRGLVEHRGDGSFLIWYSVQYFAPDQFKIYLVGNVAPDWGGPSTSNLCLAVEPFDEGCVLKVSDAHHGRVSDEYIGSLQSGWTQLFGEGLCQYVENSTK